MVYNHKYKYKLMCFMKKTSTLFLKSVLVFIAAIVLTFLLWFPQVEGRNANSDPISLYFNDPFLAYVYLTSVPFFFAIFQAIKFLGYIDKNIAFTKKGVLVFRNIKRCAVLFSIFIALALPYVFMFAQDDDSPGVVLIAGVIAFASFVIATTASIFQKLLQNAVDLKSENDLTV